jgi:ADP-heptose:LPS heptosyltransferase
MTSLLPPKHIVDRYFEGISELGILNDGKGLDHFIPPQDQVNPAQLFFRGDETAKYLALVVGGSYHTKKIPLNKLREIVSLAKLPVILLGGREDKPIAETLLTEFPWLINTCGNLSVNQSASVIQQAEWVITSDTGMMHMAAAFRKKTISVWGNTIPEFGMSPYKPEPENRILEINYLGCRPCSKLGYAKCPRGHFKCMNDINYDFVKELK